MFTVKTVKLNEFALPDPEAPPDFQPWTSFWNLTIFAEATAVTKDRRYRLAAQAAAAAGAVGWPRWCFWSWKGREERQISYWENGDYWAQNSKALKVLKAMDKVRFCTIGVRFFYVVILTLTCAFAADPNGQNHPPMETFAWTRIIIGEQEMDITNDMTCPRYHPGSSYCALSYGTLSLHWVWILNKNSS